ncbi:unnamed protein product [Adineta ricciae]|uniref:G-protein coupled receptors family 1 profile domain-containing protein n=1 Tax=Adineta ricciae TaxID=249248 RepID=A0A815HU71_ADIRI|nr:unnamed protein product [Adineta ricciae]
MDIPNIVKFWLFVVFLVPSILCSIFNLYHFLFNRTLRQSLHNHVVTILLFIGLIYMLTAIIWFTHLYRTGVALVPTHMFCLIWTYLDFVLAITMTLLTAWASVERHILIFHQNLISTPVKRWIFHYLPLIIFTIYPLIFYFIALFVLSCDIPFDYNVERCRAADCVGLNENLRAWDSWGNNVVPIFVIVIFSIALIVRVWYGKCRMGQRFQWRNYRKMTFQLLSISSLYIVLSLPAMLIYTMCAVGVPCNSTAIDFFYNYLYIYYFIIFLTPFVSIVSLPELRAKFQHLMRFRWPQARAVFPTRITTVNTRDLQMVKITNTVQQVQNIDTNK